MIRTPCLPPFFTSRLCSPIHRLTSLLTCQLALSHTNTRTFLPAATSFSDDHERKRVVTPLTGRPSTNLSALARNYGDVFWDYIASVVGGDHAADAQRVPVRLRHRNSVEAYLAPCPPRWLAGRSSCTEPPQGPLSRGLRELIQGPRGTSPPLSVGHRSPPHGRPRRP